MKAQVVKCSRFMTHTDQAHRQATHVTSIVIPEADNLVITIYYGILFVETAKMGPKCEVLAEIDFPDELVRKAIDWRESRQRIQDIVSKATKTQAADPA